MYGSNSLNCCVPEQRSSSYIIISVEEMTAPAARMRSSPIFQFHSERAPTASEATWTRYPSLSAPSAVWVTQMCASMPHNNSVLRLPGSFFKPARNSSLPKQPNSSLSIVLTSATRDAISGTVAPSPLLYCVVTMAGMDRILASRISNCEFLTMVSLLKIGGSSFSWMSTTIRAHCAASSGLRAASAESGTTVLIRDDISPPLQPELPVYCNACHGDEGKLRNRACLSFVSLSPERGKAKVRTLLTCYSHCVNLLAKPSSPIRRARSAIVPFPSPQVHSWCHRKYGSAPFELGNLVARRWRAPAVLLIFWPSLPVAPARLASMDPC